MKNKKLTTQRDLNGVQWFYFLEPSMMKRRRKGKWAPFNLLENCALETAYQQEQEEVTFGAGLLPACIPDRTQRNDIDGSSRKILRGTWFYQASDGSLQPYPEHVADHLECFFSEISESDEMLFYIQHGKQMKRNSQLFSSLNEGIFVGEGSGGKRFVHRAAEGEFCQVSESGTFRYVTPIYQEGRLEMKAVTPSLLENCGSKTSEASSGFWSMLSNHDVAILPEVDLQQVLTDLNDAAVAIVDNTRTRPAKKADPGLLLDWILPRSSHQARQLV
ncbi:hypothetical protein GUITHDRAFT_164078 [Guillardia theta CCMP2712]|uniref:WWE domain-containing protein n=1 Tax=Guillardia theta (strain CCMP2712) TaxID=905079 RepID=L1J2D7_GUITC|nr:hypothetical protein GUITHDRAFT_164078 [Guillardia theta CCMP2712]EKX42693.1 hypothetical protein GUITHDRAFT_164078 [Guillardia theta CCMP2712]|eukprot:XP_005829673.1 hypothetical protein GUITHDRAFT_164078 [Guillardia theta CCMP2712]